MLPNGGVASEGSPLLRLLLPFSPMGAGFVEEEGGAVGRALAADDKGVAREDRWRRCGTTGCRVVVGGAVGLALPSAGGG